MRAPQVADYYTAAWPDFTPALTVLTRQLPGDWEGDLIKGAGNASAIGTLAERKTRYVILTKMKDGKRRLHPIDFSCL